MRCPIWLISSLLVCCSGGYAATFSQNGGGTQSSYSVIDRTGGGDYSSLFEAAADFNSFAGSAAADYTFYINSDTTETEDVCFGNATNGHTVTLRPMGAPRTVAFDPARTHVLKGRLVIGTTTLDSLTSSVKTDHFLIDGSLDKDSRDLTLLETTTTGNLGSVINIFGDSDFCAVRNTHVRNGAAVFGKDGVALTSYRSDAESLNPDYAEVENCEIGSPELPSASGISSTFTGRSSKYVSPQRSILICRNDVFSWDRGLQLSYTNDVVAELNRISVTMKGSIGYSMGIACSCAYDTTGGLTALRRNTVVVRVPFGTAQGFGIYLEAYAPAAIEGNMVSVIEPPSPGYVFQAPVGINYSGRANAQARIAHNSVLVDAQVVGNYSSLMPSGIRIFSNVPSNSIEVLNNLTSIDAYGGACLELSYTTSTVVRGNAWGPGMGASVLKKSPSTLDFTDDGSNHVFYPRAFFESDEDLHLGVYPSGISPGVQLDPSSDLSTDIDGDQRNQYMPFPGADEMDGPPLDPVDLGITQAILSANPGANAPVTYRITVENSSRTTATQAAWTEKIPPGMEFVGAAQSGVRLRSVSNEVVGEIGTLPPFSSATAEVTLQAAEPGVYPIEASVAGNVNDPDLRNNVTTDSLTLEPHIAVADLAITNGASVAALMGQEVIYRITATNNGPDLAANVVLSDLLPANAILKSTSTSIGTIEETTDRITVRIPELPVNHTAYIMIVLTPQQAGVFRNTAELASATHDPYATNNTATAETSVPDPVTSGPDLSPMWVRGFTSSQRRQKGSRDVVHATLRLSNVGDQRSSKSKVRVLVSVDQKAGDDDLVVGSFSCGQLPPGRSAQDTIKAGLPAGLSAQGKYLIAVADPDNAIPEPNEGNNTAVLEIAR